VVNGKSTTTVNVTTATLLAQPQVINIHESAQEATVYVGGGTIATQAPTGMPSIGGGGMAQQPTAFLPWALLALVGTALVAALGIRRRAATTTHERVVVAAHIGVRSPRPGTPCSPRSPTPSPSSSPSSRT